MQGCAMNMPFEDASFDAATMGYGLRNVASIPKALMELRRVLKPGAKAAILDFNNSTNPAIDAFQVKQSSFRCYNSAVPACPVHRQSKAAIRCMLEDSVKCYML